MSNSADEHVGIPRADHEALYDLYLSELRKRFPRFEVIKKSESRINRFIDKLLKIITFGGQSSYLGGYITTLGQKIYVPDSWDNWAAGDRYCVMRHEAIHMQQFRRFTWLGMALAYILLPLPMGWSGRKFIELPAYCESLTATWQVYGEEAARDPAELRRIVRQFTGPSYAWMWLNGKAIRRALEAHLDELSRNPPPILVVPSS